jgi:hypothetical protein
MPLQKRRPDEYTSGRRPIIKQLRNAGLQTWPAEEDLASPTTTVSSSKKFALSYSHARVRGLIWNRSRAGGCARTGAAPSW